MDVPAKLRSCTWRRYFDEQRKENEHEPEWIYLWRDYNPEQWLAMPEILEQDIEYMKEAHINEVTLGVFSWSVLEPEEGVYHLEWLEKIMDQLYKNEISVILSTPSAARPKWLADKYPEVLRVNADRTKICSADAIITVILRRFTGKRWGKLIAC